jgi:hypothetical protein
MFRADDITAHVKDVFPNLISDAVVLSIIHALAKKMIPQVSDAFLVHDHKHLQDNEFQREDIRLRSMSWEMLSSLRIVNGAANSVLARTGLSVNISWPAPNVL